MLAVSASPGQGSVQVEAENSPSGTFAVVVIRPRKGGDGLKYTVPMSHMAKLGEINRTIRDPLARYDAVVIWLLLGRLLPWPQCPSSHSCLP